MLDFFVEETTTGDIWIMEKNTPYDKLIVSCEEIDLNALSEFLDYIREKTKDVC